MVNQILLIIIISGSTLMAARPDKAALGKKLDSWLQQVVTRHQMVGLTAAVTYKDEVIYSGAFGVSALGQGKTLTTGHLFHFASVSKPFVATAVMQLVEQGKMELDAPLTRYLPYFTMADPNYQKITIRHMLQHTSGIPDVRDYGWDNPQTDPGEAERYVRDLADRKLDFVPGEGSRYSNRAFDALGDVIAKVSGMSFEDYVKKNILDPLGMKNSSFYYPETPNNLRTRGHEWELKPALSKVYPYNRRHAPSSTLNSSVMEMTHWLRANMNGGTYKGKTIVSQKSHHVLTGEGKTSGVGLSWFMGQHRGKRTVGHSGSDTGYGSMFLMLPDDGWGVVLVSNYDNSPMRRLQDGVVDILLGHDPDVPKMGIWQPFANVYLKSGLEKAKAHYRKLEKEQSHAYSFSPSQLNRLGYQLLVGMGETEKAIEIFGFNTELYPKVANCWDSLAEAHLKSGNKQKAIDLYLHALEVDPNFGNAKKVLKELGVNH